MTSDGRIQAGAVDWSGDNSGIYLKAERDGPYLSLASLFRVVLSPHGRGHALVLIEQDPAEPEQTTLAVCLNDNKALARWLVSDYLRHFQQFAGLAAVEQMTYPGLDETQSQGDGISEHIEIVRGAGMELRLAWRGLGAPFMVTLEPEHSATGIHAMYSVFVDVQEAEITIDGRRLAGAVQPRDYQGRPSTTSFLAFSESWVSDTAT